MQLLHRCLAFSVSLYESFYFSSLIHIFDQEEAFFIGCGPFQGIGYKNITERHCFLRLAVNYMASDIDFFKNRIFSNRNRIALAGSFRLKKTRRSSCQNQGRAETNRKQGKKKNKSSHIKKPKKPNLYAKVAF